MSGGDRFTLAGRAGFIRTPSGVPTEFLTDELPGRGRWSLSHNQVAASQRRVARHILELRPQMQPLRFKPLDRECPRPDYDLPRSDAGTRTGLMFTLQQDEIEPLVVAGKHQQIVAGDQAEGVRDRARVRVRNGAHFDQIDLE